MYFFKIGHKLFLKKRGKKPQIGVVVSDLTCMNDVYDNQAKTQFSWMGLDIPSIQFRQFIQLVFTGYFNLLNS